MTQDKLIRKYSHWLTDVGFDYLEYGIFKKEFSLDLTFDEWHSLLFTYWYGNYNKKMQ